MNRYDDSTDLSVIQANVLDHAPEFVEIVYTQAPGTYRALLSSRKFDGRLANDPAFNHGKLFAYAEFDVFRREFRSRFPGASDFACINAFAGLFLKNDISIANLVEYTEGAEDEEQLLLNTPEP
ncbi:MAG: hypothetical protein HKO85_00935 [Xanthomonadales bacterium]|nr:hypothetical protein [Gammaproteobacteria bacterium]MBT8050819.1 hypothetical protein [Gammaproteobacteria bacterium]MBT8055576.1 hypothetical protein [Gammaproteobacteria bacterium]NNJ78430.1 hypothetical protein [Xanthomonadales bacterium]NNL03821.1 hypothetical protein [Xanthomonadales bacterium]